MKNLSNILAIVTTFILIGCGAGTDTPHTNPAPSKSTLRIKVIETTPPPSPIGGISLKVDYDHSTVRPAGDINENPDSSVALNGALSGDGTIMSVHNDGDTLALSIINAKGFDDGEKDITIDFDLLKGVAGDGKYTVLPGSYKAFDLDGDKIKGTEVALEVTNQ